MSSDEYSATSDHEDPPFSLPTVEGADNHLSGGNVFAKTSFDNFFLHSSKPSRTSTNVFSSNTVPLTAEQFEEATSNHIGSFAPPALAQLTYTSRFSRFQLELIEGYNLLLYGAGSKRKTLNEFALYLNHKWDAHILVINGFSPHLTLKDILASLEGMSRVLSPISDNSLDGRLSRMLSHFTSQSSEAPRLCLLIHNIDAPLFQTTRLRTFLSTWASASRAHIVGTVDDIASPLSWSLRESVALKSSPLTSGSSNASSASGCAWLWHDITTLQPYDYETMFADRSSLVGASRNNLKTQRTTGDQLTNTKNTAISEVAARHILVSVTQKAKRLFLLLAQKQLQTMDDGDTMLQDPQRLGTEYPTLFNLARDNFIATNDTSLAALLSEFRDHGLVVSAPQGGSGEVLFIPVRKKALLTITADLGQNRL